MIDLFDRQPLPAKPPRVPPETGSATVDDLGSFGWLRNERDRAIMLEIRHANGSITAYSYAWLESAEFNPSEGIVLNFSGKNVRLIGRNLNAEARPNVRLFESLLRHRVLWVQEADHTTLMEAVESAVVIEQIRLEAAWNRL